jgi:hypothetical protein
MLNKLKLFCFFCHLKGENDGRLQREQWKLEQWKLEHWKV